MCSRIVELVEPGAVESTGTENMIVDSAVEAVEPVEPVEDGGAVEDTFCRKVEGYCNTHGVELKSRKLKTRVWRKNAKGTYRNVYVMVQSEVCPEFLSLDSRKTTKPLGVTPVQGDYQRKQVQITRQAVAKRKCAGFPRRV